MVIVRCGEVAGIAGLYWVGFFIGAAWVLFTQWWCRRD